MPGTISAKKAWLREQLEKMGAWDVVVRFDDGFVVGYTRVKERDVDAAMGEAGPEHMRPILEQAIATFKEKEAQRAKSAPFRGGLPPESQ